MAKLYFSYAAMNAGKSTILLQAAYKIIAQRLYQFGAAFAVAINFGVFFLGYTFEYADRQTILSFTAKFCRTQNGGVIGATHILTIVEVGVAMRGTTDAPGIKQHIAIERPAGCSGGDA